MKQRKLTDRSAFWSDEPQATAEGLQPGRGFEIVGAASGRWKNSRDANRRMRKTARPVVWEGAGAQSSAPDPITTVALSHRRSASDRQ